eukprot:CAMPEP_0197435482 /NCGR_PEP_ID=MMETSP1175-20131217/3062_1 /TAXON_ID=1003142 /ORGANISM="Triceratium dubium, Strain CCMP147" /LENGTH=181 /DNA_ID=CAMNT_0042964527 /DNA_START=405 /DNA_END=950 /DNA_ORIENTATION=-
MSTTRDVITTERLVLRSAQPDDIHELFRVVFSDAQVMSQAFRNDHVMASKEDAIDFFDDHFDFGGTGKALGVLCLKETGEVIGFSGLLRCDVFGEDDDYEIGFVLGRDYWGKGYATEIGKAQVMYGLGEAGCSRLLGVVRADNIASKKALSKSGMAYHSTRETSDRGEREIFVVERKKKQQ